MSKQLVLSNSEIQEFRACKRKWFFSQYLGYRPDPEPVYFTEGSLWHELMEVYYLNRDKFSNWPKADKAVLDAVDTVFTRHEHPKMDKEKIRRIFDAYVQEMIDSGADQGLEVTKTEHTSMMHMSTFDDVEFWLRGQIDMLAYDTELRQHVLLDHKFVKGFKAYIGKLPVNQQMRTYALLHMIDPDLPDTGRAYYNMVRKADPNDKRTKPPYMMREELYVSSDVLSAHAHELIYTASEINNLISTLDEHDIIVPPTVSLECDWCPYKSACVLMGDNSSDWEFVLQSGDFKQVDPNARYNEPQTPVQIHNVAPEPKPQGENEIRTAPYEKSSFSINPDSRIIELRVESISPDVHPQISYTVSSHGVTADYTTRDIHRVESQLRELVEYNEPEHRVHTAADQYLTSMTTGVLSTDPNTSRTVDPSTGAFHHT